MTGHGRNGYRTVGSGGTASLRFSERDTYSPRRLALKRKFSYKVSNVQHGCQNKVKHDLRLGDIRDEDPLVCCVLPSVILPCSIYCTCPPDLSHLTQAILCMIPRSGVFRYGCDYSLQAGRS